MRILGLGVVALAASAAGGQEVVFDGFQDIGGVVLWALTDNHSGINETDSRVEDPAGAENAAQIGQAIQLGGTARELDTFSIRLFRGGGQPDWVDLTGTLELSLYRTDGFEPTQILWSGEAAFTIPVATVGFGRSVDVTFQPDVVAPTRIFWSVAVRDVVTQPAGDSWGVRAFGKDGAGPGRYLGPTLALDSTTQEWRLGLGYMVGLPFNQLQARITATPGAATAGLAILALGAPRRRPTPSRLERA